MVVVNFKPQAARQLEARSRARQMGVRVAMVELGRWYVSGSQSQPGVVYDITRGREGWECECKGYIFHGSCKHLGAVERRAEREGWAFGKVKPICRPAKRAA